MPGTEGFRVPLGPSIIDKLWAELLHQMGKLFEVNSDPENHGPIVVGGQSGHCLGLAKALAIVLNPYDPDIEEVRREAMRRYRGVHNGT